MPPGRSMAGKDPMDLHASFIELLRELSPKLAGMGLYAGAMIRTMQKAIDAYRQAKESGDREAMVAAEANANRLLKKYLERVVGTIAKPPSWETYE